jgi:hypothetical protein
MSGPNNAADDDRALQAQRRRALPENMASFKIPGTAEFLIGEFVMTSYFIVRCRDEIDENRVLVATVILM